MGEWVKFYYPDSEKWDWECSECGNLQTFRTKRCQKCGEIIGEGIEERGIHDSKGVIGDESHDSGCGDNGSERTEMDD